MSYTPTNVPLIGTTSQSVQGLPINDRRGRPGYIQLGDSILGNGSNPLQPVITGSVGTPVATVTIAGHGQWPGAWVLIRGCLQQEFNGWFQVTSYISSSAFTITLRSPATAPLATDAASSGIRMQTQSRWNDRNVFEVANQLAGNRMRYIANAGCNGQTSQEILARTTDDVLNNPMGVPDFCMFCAGVNDALNGVAIATTQANIVSIISTLRNGGVEPIACTLPPIATTATGYSTTVRGFYLQLNSWLRSYCKRNNIKLVDLYGAWVNPTDANGSWATNYATSDGIHPSPLAVQALALATLKTDVQSWTPAVQPNAIAIVDTYAVSTSSLQMNAYPLTGGSGGTGSGTVATGYIVAVTGAAATTNTVPSRSDGYGSNQKMVMVSTNANDSVTFRFTSAQGTTYAGQVSAGDKIKLQVVVDLTDITALSRFDLWMEFTNAGTTFFSYGTTQSSGTNWTADMANMVIETPEVVVPTGGLTTLNMQLRGQFSGAGGATVGIGRIWLGKITA